MNYAMIDCVMRIDLSCQRSYYSYIIILYLVYNFACVFFFIDNKSFIVVNIFVTRTIKTRMCRINKYKLFITTKTLANKHVLRNNHALYIYNNLINWQCLHNLFVYWLGKYFSERQNRHSLG